MSKSPTDSSRQSGSNTTIQRDNNSPYHLKPYDNPGALITSVLPTNENYPEWSMELHNSLQAKSEIGFIVRTISKATNEILDHARWLAANSMIVG